ncbi:MAG TPA: SIMPL domain-containing protein [Cyclobacteriaceae bacterium]
MIKLRITLLALLLTSFFAASAQEVFKGEHFIEVTGTAQTEIEPNEIYTIIRLREFEENRQKTALEKLDKDFFNAIKEAGIDRKRVELADAGSKLDKLGKKEKDAFRDKTYQIKLTSAAELEKLIEKLEPVKVDFFDIIKLSHSDLDKMKIDLKVKALQAAKTKAETLLKSIGSEVGKPIMVRDWDVEPAQPMMNMRANYSMKMEDGVAQEEPAIGFKKIKLQAQITAQFEIK